MSKPIRSWASNARRLSPALAAALLLATFGRGQEGVPAPETTDDEEFELPSYVDPLEQEQYFATADYDESGWISFDEAREALLLDRDGFFTFDADGDLRISAEEFEQRYEDSILRTGGFQPPVPKQSLALAPPRSAIELRNAYDRNLDGRLGPAELQVFIDDYGLPKITGVTLAGQLDANASGGLELDELAAASALVDAYKQSPAGMFEVERPRSLEELYGEPVPRTNPVGIAEPPYIRGPVHPFFRLDLDRNDKIDVQDLFELQFPLTLPVRPSSVLAAIDRDGDGALDREEFRAAMR